MLGSLSTCSGGLLQDSCWPFLTLWVSGVLFSCSYFGFVFFLFRSLLWITAGYPEVKHIPATCEGHKPFCLHRGEREQHEAWCNCG